VTSPGDWVQGDPHARVEPAPAAPDRSGPASNDEPEALDLLALAGSSFYKRIIPLGLGAVAVAAAIVWFIVRR